MAALTNPPFMHQKGELPLHLRELSPDEFAQLERLREQAELARKLSTLKQEETKNAVP